MYNSHMLKDMLKEKKIDFTEARQNLSNILDRVQKSGPITILRHGKPAAVVISHDEYQLTIQRKKKPFKLAGSMKIKKGVDIDKALQEISEKNIRESRLGLERSIKEFAED